MGNLEERKIIVYRVVENKVKDGFKADREWHTASVFKHEYQPQNKTFEIQLIGLDGGLKVRKSELLTIEELFETIDSMPIRQREMRKN